ncbi:MAG: DUF47 family protein [Muribaculaceae bacterium]|nr:DUF47 family protein [Muribaculaceae bacterium]
MTNSFLSKFTPKETKFFPLLKQLSDVLTRAAHTLLSGVSQNSSPERYDCYKKIKDLEHEGDRITQLILNELGLTFITPFDREDIHDLASALDDVIDGINSCAKRIATFNPAPINENGKELCRLIDEAALCISRAIDELENFRAKPAELKECCQLLHKIEHDADDEYERFVTQLFETENDCKQLIKIKDITNEMEKTTDYAEHVGKILQNYIVKYS